jgi:hypothetical protein
MFIVGDKNKDYMVMREFIQFFSDITPNKEEYNMYKNFFRYEKFGCFDAFMYQNNIHAEMFIVSDQMKFRQISLSIMNSGMYAIKDFYNVKELGYWSTRVELVKYPKVHTLCQYMIDINNSDIMYYDINLSLNHIIPFVFACNTTVNFKIINDTISFFLEDLNKLEYLKDLKIGYSGFKNNQIILLFNIGEYKIYLALNPCNIKVSQILDTGKKLEFKIHTEDSDLSKSERWKKYCREYTTRKRTTPKRKRASKNSVS